MPSGYLSMSWYFSTEEFSELSNLGEDFGLLKSAICLSAAPSLILFNAQFVAWGAKCSCPLHPAHHQLAPWLFELLSFQSLKSIENCKNTKPITKNKWTNNKKQKKKNDNNNNISNNNNKSLKLNIQPFFWLFFHTFDQDLCHLSQLLTSYDQLYIPVKSI